VRVRVICRTLSTWSSGDWIRVGRALFAQKEREIDFIQLIIYYKIIKSNFRYGIAQITSYMLMGWVILQMDENYGNIEICLKPSQNPTNPEKL
jgi:hypothetical protein